MSTSKDVSPHNAGSRAGKKDPSFLFLIGGLACLALALVHFFFFENEADPSRAFSGWLLGASFWISIQIGLLFLLMIWWLFDAGWSVIIRRQIEHVLSGFFWLGLVMLPLILIAVFMAGSDKISWIWMNPEAIDPSGHGTVDHDVLLQAKSPFLNPPFFVVRFFVIFAIWSGLVYLFRSWSFKMDATGDHKYIHRSRKLAAAGIVLCALATTLGSIDWFKSLNYHWFSTMYGVWFFAASMRAALSALVLICFWQAGRDRGLRGILQPAHTYLIVCLMLAFTVFWAYISFSQFFIIYNANIPEETFWYNIRELAADGSTNSWYYVSRSLIYLHFFAPFLWLLWNKNKYGLRLKVVAVWILVFHFVDLAWNILPQKMGEAEPVDGVYFTVRAFSINPSEVLVFLAAGSICAWAFLCSLNSQRVIPIRDPRILESIHVHE